MPVSSDGLRALLLLPEAAACAPEPGGAVEIMSAARAGSSRYARLSRSPQSPSGCRRAGRSACAPATRRCTPDGSGAHRQSISLGSLHKSTAAFTASTRNRMSLDILLEPRLRKATYGRMQCHAAEKGTLHEETGLHCSPPSRLSRSPHSQRSVKQLHSRTRYSASRPALPSARSCCVSTQSSAT